MDWKIHAAQPITKTLQLIHFKLVKLLMNCASPKHPTNASGSSSIACIYNCINHKLLLHQVILIQTGKDCQANRRHYEHIMHYQKGMKKFIPIWEKWKWVILQWLAALLQKSGSTSVFKRDSCAELKELSHAWALWASQAAFRWSRERGEYVWITNEISLWGNTSNLHFLTP